MIIHITGPPGAGKSTLADQFKVDKLDLDHVHQTLAKKYKCKHNDIFQKYVDDKIQQYRNQNKHLLIVGMHYPDPRTPTCNSRPFHLKINADVKLCLNPGVETIVRQLIKREISHIQLAHLDVKQMLKDTKWWINTFVKEGYVETLPDLAFIKQKFK